MTLLIAANEGVKNPTLWYPTLLGFLVVVSAVVLFCGSVYVLLATNLGARLGFLVAIAGLSGFMVLLTLLWLTTSSPLNTLKGRVPSWKPVESVGADLARSKIPAVAAIDTKAEPVDPTEASNVKAAVDAALVTPVAVAGEKPTPGKFATFDKSTDYLVPETFETGGGGQFDVRSGGEFPWVHFSFHQPKYAVSTVCPIDVAQQQVPFGDPIPPPRCDPAQKVSHIVFERDLGSLRVPPFMAFLAASIIFGLSLLGLHWRERDLQAAEDRAEAAAKAPVPATTEPEAEPAPANA